MDVDCLHHFEYRGYCPRRTARIKLLRMKRTIALVTAMLLSVPAAFAQDWAKQTLEKSSRNSEWVAIKHDNRVVQTFVVYPEVKQKAPVVIVIHEIYGLTDWARSVADQLAANGYIAVAPDLLSGFGPKGGGTGDFAGTQDAMKAVSGLDPDILTGDLNAVADYAKKLPAANGKIAVSGFCWGGGQSFRFATNRKDLSAAFVFYGPPPKDVSTIAAPVYGFYAANDARIAPPIPATVTPMKTAAKTYDPVTYDRARHGFLPPADDPATTNPHNKNAHDHARD